MFRKYLFFLVIFLSLPNIVLAQSLSQKRTVEEQKRQDLQSSEAATQSVGLEASTDNIKSSRELFQSFLLKEALTHDDVLQGLVIVMGQSENWRNKEKCYEFLKEKGLLPSSYDISQHNQPVYKGELAYMLIRVLDIKGGIMLHIFRNSQRYALKELVFKRLMFYGNIKDEISGKEFVWTITQIADYWASESDEN